MHCFADTLLFLFIALFFPFQSQDVNTKGRGQGGDALEIIGELDENWDLVFIDADKENYIHYFNLVLPKLRPKGFILADNVLFHGQVLEKEIKGKNAKAIQAFNDFVAERRDIERLLLPVRDGLYVIRKL